jgi:hypothetical protein
VPKKKCKFKLVILQNLQNREYRFLQPQDALHIASASILRQVFAAIWSPDQRQNIYKAICFNHVGQRPSKAKTNGGLYLFIA